MTTGLIDTGGMIGLIETGGSGVTIGVTIGITGVRTGLTDTNGICVSVIEIGAGFILTG